jgi:S1-C subfamily serine protease
VITSVDGERVSEPDDVAGAISRKKPGEKVDVEIRRSGGATDQLSVDLGNRPR